MKLTAIKPIAGDLVQACFDGGSIRLSEDELLNRELFLDRIRERFGGRGVSNAPRFQHEREWWIQGIWAQCNPDLFSQV